MSVEVKSRINEAVQALLDELVDQGREIGVQVCAWQAEDSRTIIGDCIRAAL